MVEVSLVVHCWSERCGILLKLSVLLKLLLRVEIVCLGEISILSSLLLLSHRILRHWLGLLRYERIALERVPLLVLLGLVIMLIMLLRVEGLRLRGAVESLRNRDGC